ncbi:MAG: sugar-binding protein [Candidatus Fervidibacter sp.]|uniref:sugar-binding protein n=1 Tax=Candidatus Fervidibacter sp. TaxID=3100871 RepID=UPI00404AD627
MRVDRINVFVWLVLCFQVCFTYAQTVTSTIETFNRRLWERAWSKAAGTISFSQESLANLPHDRSMEIEVHFSGTGFEWFSVKPSNPIWVPGEAKSIIVRYKVNALGYSVTLESLDGWGRPEANGKRFSLTLPAEGTGKWQTATFVIPENWIRPVAISELSVHNWNRQSEKGVLKIWVDQINVRTDLSSTDFKTGLPTSWRPNPEGEKEQKRQPPPFSLLQTELTGPAENFVFTGEQPILAFRARSWFPQIRHGKISLQVVDLNENKVFRAEKSVPLLGFVEEAFVLPIKRFGWYQGRVSLTVEGEADRSEQIAFAFVPFPLELTEAEKLLSPYGLNVHGGRERLAIETFRKIGVVWFRDYAFNFETMKRARSDGRFDGWPWYHQLLWRYQRSGAKLLACLQGSIKRPQLKSGEAVAVGPEPAWRREVASIIASFPQITHWELDNEYDFPTENRQAEEQIVWENYRAYHKAFAEIVNAIGGGSLVAVEQGQTGIYPERIRKCVESGDFERIEVVNVHHYYGSDAPELNVVRTNGAQATRGKVALFYDLLREAKRAATRDNKRRQLWLTEFGWDTLAGHPVSPFEQAVYLQRGWLLALSAGVDKVFWFYDFDSPEHRQFFDGCGLLTADGQPKPSLCALAAPTHLLPSPRYVGDCNAGWGTKVFVFETNGKLVLALWSVEHDAGPVVNFDSGQLYDTFSNPLPQKTFKLNRAPLFAVGISRNSQWFKQTAYSIDTPYLVVVAAGDSFPIRVRVKGNRDEQINATLQVAVPDKWKVDREKAKVNVPPNSQGLVSFNITVASGEPECLREVLVTVEEDGQKLKEILVKVIVIKPVTVKVSLIEGEPGTTKLKVQLINNSSRPISGTLMFRLPASWKATPDSVTVVKLNIDEVRTIEVDLTWTDEWQSGESVQVVFGEMGQTLAWDFIVPSKFKIHRAPKVDLDGELGEWGGKWAVPSWLLRSSFGEVNARLFLAWSEEGFYVAAEVRDSTIKVTDPKSFWNGDCLELFIDTRNDKRPRSFEPGDHQFWFVPLVNEGRVYAGQWKRCNEIPETLYNLSIKGAAKRLEDGYTLEFFLPAYLLRNLRPQVGAKMGLNINLTVKGKRYDREVYWHRQKDSGVLQAPNLWGTIELSD